MRKWKDVFMQPGDSHFGNVDSVSDSVAGAELVPGVGTLTGSGAGGRLTEAGQVDRAGENGLSTHAGDRVSSREREGLRMNVQTPEQPKIQPRPIAPTKAPPKLADVRGSDEIRTREHMLHTLHRERARADRTNHEFSLVLFRVKQAAKVTHSVERLIRTCVARARTTDEVGWFNEKFLGVILPDTNSTGAWRFAEDVCELVAGKMHRPIYAVYTYPKDWFEGDDTDGSDGAKRPDVLPPSSNGHGVNGQSNGSTNGNGQVQKEATTEKLPGVLADLAASAPKPPRAMRIEDFFVKPLPWWKRMLDISCALVGIVMTSPLWLLAYCLIKMRDPGPVFFMQSRAGLGGKPFKIYKFRTMYMNAEARKAELKKLSEQDGPAFKMKNDPRIFPGGEFLRKTSIDELPQMLNVLKGNMTLVGPRPLPMSESAQCEGWQRRRLLVTPGMTCIWQVRGRSTVTFAEWARMDIAYIKSRSIIADIKLILATIPAVLARRGAK